MGAYEALPVIFQRTSMLMLAHCIPITLVQLAVPELLRLAGEDPELCRLASAYAIRLLPSLYIEALSRWAAPQDDDMCIRLLQACTRGLEQVGCSQTSLKSACACLPARSPNILSMWLPPMSGWRMRPLLHSVPP